MPVRTICLAALAAILTLTALPAFAQGSGRRADVGEVSKAIGGDTKKYYGPTDLPRPPFAEDGREFVYLDPVFVTAIRGRRPARTYSFWPRITMSKESPSSNFFRQRSMVRDALMLALAQIAQIDWPGEIMFDAALASRAAQARIDQALGGGKIDAIDFLYIDVQVF